MADRAGDEREDLVAKRERWRTLPTRIPRSELIEEQASFPNEIAGQIAYPFRR